MPTLTVIEHLHVFEQTGLRFVSGVVIAMHDEFSLQGVKEAFHRRIVPAIGLAAHALADGMLIKQRPIVRRRVERSAIGMQDFRRGAALPDRHGQGIHCKRPVDTTAHGPAHDRARVKVQDRRQVKPAGAGRDEGDVGQPAQVGASGAECPFQQVRRGFGLARIRRDPEAAYRLGHDLGLTHQGRHRVLAAIHSLMTKLLVDPRRTVSITAGGMDRPDVRGQCNLAPAADAGWTPVGCVIAAGRHPQDTAHHSHRVAVTMRVNELVLHLDSRAK